MSRVRIAKRLDIRLQGPTIHDVGLGAEYFGYGESERQLLSELSPALREHADALVEAFYQHLSAFPETREFLTDRAVVERLLRVQRSYLLSLAGPEIDESYLSARRRIGETHERIGLEQEAYLGAYSYYLSLLIPIVRRHFEADPGRAERALVALQKLLMFDAHLALGTYIQRRELDLHKLNQQLGEASRNLAEDLQETGEELQRTSERARAAEQLASIGTLVAGLAHEIGTPMGVIQGHAQLLEPAVSDDAGRWRLRTIREQVDRIQRIMQSLLNMARPGRSRRRPVDLEALVETTLAFLREKLKRHDVELKTAYAEGLESVLGDSERLQQVLLNLVLNAVDAMDDGGTLQVSVDRAPDAFEIRVSDTGPGIPEDQLAQIFEPFHTSKPAGEGNGLGLAVAKGIVADHGGKLTVEKTGADGTTFRVLLPSD